MSIEDNARIGEKDCYRFKGGQIRDRQTKLYQKVSSNLDGRYHCLDQRTIVW